MYSHFRHSSTPCLNQLWVVAVCSNPQRFQSRYRLFQRFRQVVERVGANLQIVELAQGDRPFEVTEAGQPHHLQLRTRDELWHKERLINLGVQRLPPDWRYVAWVDADLEFVRPDWLEETCHQLQQHEVVQLFQSAIDLGPQGEALFTFQSFASSFVQGKPYPSKAKKAYYPVWHPGYGWAYRREAWEALGGMIDTGALGASDHHMASALLGRVRESVHDGVTPGYLEPLLRWQERATGFVRENIGFVPGTIYHHWHGKKRDRRYEDRWNILVDGRFDPSRDLKTDWQGLYAFSHEGARLRNAFRAYFRARNEDSIDLE